MLKYDDVLNRQREAIYSDRRHILEGDDLHERTQKFLEDVIDEVLDAHTAEGNPDEWDFDALWTELKTLYPIGITIDEVVAEAGEKGRVNRDFVRREILSDAKLAYQRREQQLGSPAMRELERRVVLSVIDRRWRDHLYEMDYLKDGIGLRAMAQRDPLVEYQREGFAMFQQMMGSIREETVGFLFNLEVEVAPQGGGRADDRGQGPRPAERARREAQLLGAERRPAASRCATSAARCSRRRRSVRVARWPRARRPQRASRRAVRSDSKTAAATSRRRTVPSVGRRSARVADHVREPAAGVAEHRRAGRGVRRVATTPRPTPSVERRRQSTLIALARQRWSNPSRRIATARDRARWCTMTTASTTPSAGSQMMTRPSANAGPLRGLALDAARTSGEHDALREVAVDVVVHPAGELLEVARAGEHLDDAVGEARAAAARDRGARCGAPAGARSTRRGRRGIVRADARDSGDRRGVRSSVLQAGVARRSLDRATDAPPVGGRSG